MRAGTGRVGACLFRFRLAQELELIPEQVRQGPELRLSKLNVSRPEEDEIRGHGVD